MTGLLPSLDMSSGSRLQLSSGSRGSKVDFLCGWGAGCVETCILFPSSKLIFRQQLHGLLVKEAVHQLRSEGLPMLYRGLLPPLIMRTSTRALMYGMFDQYQVQLNCHHSPPGSSFTWCHASAAFLAGVTEALLCPLERIQVLLQHSAFHDHFKNTKEAFTVVRAHGIPEFYRGMSLVLVRNGLSNACFFTLREPLKRTIVQNVSPNHAPSPIVSLMADFVSGGVLGASISTVFFPINVVKHRMQSMIGTPFESAINVFRVVWEERNRSIKELYRGVHLNYSRSLVAWGITNSVYEFLKRSFEEAR
uniref:Solute carrier family 25 member 51 n=1 Tax=Steinernema glaseri TaxID=37863 RepID=A0A1I7Y5X0_9BILA